MSKFFVIGGMFQICSYIVDSELKEKKNDKHNIINLKKKILKRIDNKFNNSSEKKRRYIVIKK